MADTQVNLSAHAGEQVEVALQSTPSTGAIWRLAPGVRQPDSLHEHREPTQGIGGAVTQLFTFSYTHPGKYELAFDLKRPWEPEVRNHVRVHVDVR